VADLSVPGARWVAARGGLGGKGNAFFKTSTNQSPDYAQTGTLGEIVAFRLVLKSVADVGLIGLPNVGKSTFISKVSAARPKVANYPFTTLRPNLGVVMLDDDRQFVVADIPGLIPDAHQGKGLGIKFLKHIERTSLLVLLIDVTTRWDGEGSVKRPLGDDEESLKNAVLEQFNIVNRELTSYSETLKMLPRVIVLSKSDLPQSRKAFDLTQSEFRKRGFETFLLSSHTGSGVSEFLERLYCLVQENKRSLNQPNAALINV